MTSNRPLPAADRQSPKVVSSQYATRTNPILRQDVFSTEVVTNVNPQATGIQLVMKDRTGMEYVPAVMDLEEIQRVVLIRRVYNFSSFDRLIETIQINQPHRETLTEEGQMLMVELEKIANLTVSQRRQRYTVTFQYRLSLDEINAAGGALYHLETDLVIANKSLIRDVTHPKQRIADQDPLQPAIPMQQCGYNWIGINDPTQTSPDRFIVQGRRIIKLRAFNHSELPPGVWVCRMRSWDPRSPPQDDQPEYLHFPTLEAYEQACTEEDSEHIPIHRTVDQAIQALEMKVASPNLKQWEIERIRQENDLAVARNKLEKTQHDYDQLVLANEQAQQKHEQEREKHRQEMDALEKKERYEHRSYIRRETSESFKFSTDMVKYVPILLIGLGAAYVAVKTAFSR